MSRRAALAALARAVDEGGDVAVAYSATARLDPLLRRRALARIREAYYDCYGRAQKRPGDEGQLHLLRLSYLQVAGQMPGEAEIDDVDGVRRAYDATRAARRDVMPRVWWPTVGVACALLVAGAAGAVAMVRAARPPHVPDATEREAPPPTGAFATGGRPAREDALTRVLSTALTDYAIRLDRWAEARRVGAPPDELTAAEAAVSEAQRALNTPDARNALGDLAARRFDDLVTRSRSVAEALPDTVSIAADSLMEATGAFDDALGARGVAYFVDSDVVLDGSSGRRHVLLYAFTVENVAIYSADGKTIRALDLRRLDRTNWSHTLVGFSRRHLRDALVLLDQLDELLVSYILPALGAGAPMPLCTDDDADEAHPRDASLRAIEARAGEIARRDYGAASRVDAAELERLGGLLGKRQALFETWQPRVRARGLVLETPRALRMHGDFAEQLRGTIADGDIAQLVAIDRQLGDAALADAVAKIRTVLSTSVRRHEVQHRLDFARSTPLPMPAALEKYAGPTPSDGTPRRQAGVARDELSAYLAELGRDEVTTAANLVMISRYLFDPRLQGTPECYAAVVIFEGLAAELGIAPSGPLVRDGGIDRAAVAGLWQEIMNRSSEELRAAARRSWAKFFGADPSPIQMVATGDP